MRKFGSSVKSHKPQLRMYKFPRRKISDNLCFLPCQLKNGPNLTVVRLLQELFESLLFFSEECWLKNRICSKDVVQTQCLCHGNEYPCICLQVILQLKIMHTKFSSRSHLSSVLFELKLRRCIIYSECEMENTSKVIKHNSACEFSSTWCSLRVTCSFSGLYSCRLKGAWPSSSDLLTPERTHVLIFPLFPREEGWCTDFASPFESLDARVNAWDVVKELLFRQLWWNCQHQSCSMLAFKLRTAGTTSVDSFRTDSTSFEA